MYEKFFKRLLDIIFSAAALMILSPVFLILIVLGAIMMKGNPFFTQLRPGKDERIFRIIKFSTMTNEKDRDGVLLPSNERLTKYGKLLRSTSLDELPELWNVLTGDMSMVGPRPLLVEYLPLYNEEQKRRHEVRPGITGYAQVNGRNAISWEEKFRYDLEYVDNISFLMDVKILIKTIKCVFQRKDITPEDAQITKRFTGTRTDTPTRLLFTSVGRRVELIQAFRDASERTNIPVYIYGADLDMTAPALSFCDERVNTPRIGTEEYIPFLMNFCKEQGIDCLIPTIDTDLLALAENKEEFLKNGTKVMVSEKKMIEICRDKRLTAQFFTSLGLCTPMLVSDYADYDRYAGYPAFIKPRNGSGSIHAYRANDFQALQRLSKEVPDYIIQPFIEGEEFTVDIFCDLDGRPIYITPRHRLETRAGEVVKTKICQDDEMIDDMRRLIREFRPCGPMTVQLIKEKDTNQKFYIEINPRFGGGAPLSMAAGAYVADALLRLLKGEEISYQEKAAEDGALYSRFHQSVRVRER